MKKILWMQFVPVFLFVSLAAGQAEQAELTSFSGDVEILLKGADDYVQAEEGMTLEAGDNIRTGSGASAEVSFNEENTNLVRVNENSDLTVTFSGDEKLEMNDGEVFTTISNLPSGSAFEIRTPTAVSGARGTDWVTKVTEEGTDVEAMDSTPYVKHFQEDGTLSKEQTFIVPGKMTSVQKFQRPMALREIPVARREQWQAVKQDVRKRGSDALIKRQQRPAFDRKEFLDKQRGMRGRDKDAAMNDPGKPGQMREGPDGQRPMLDSKEGRFDRQLDGAQGRRKPMMDSKEGSLDRQDGPDGRRPMMGRDGDRFDGRDPVRAGLGDGKQKRFIEGDIERKPNSTFDGKGRFMEEKTPERRKFRNDEKGSFGTPPQGAKGGNSRPSEGSRPPMKRGGMGSERKSPGGMQRR